MSESIEVIRAPQVVYVTRPRCGSWHWVNALAILVLSVTGYFIGSPLPSLPGEASHSFLMGYLRFAHFAAGLRAGDRLSRAHLLGDRRQPPRASAVRAAVLEPAVVEGK